MPSRVVRQQFTNPGSRSWCIGDNPKPPFHFDGQALDTKLGVMLVSSGVVRIHSDTSFAQELNKVHLCGVGFDTEARTVPPGCGFQSFQQLGRLPPTSFDTQNLSASIGEKCNREDGAFTVLGTFPNTKVNPGKTTAGAAVAVNKNNTHVPGTLESAFNPVSLKSRSGITDGPEKHLARKLHFPDFSPALLQSFH